MYQCPISIAKKIAGIFFLIGIYSIHGRRTLELQSMKLKEDQNENHTRKGTKDEKEPKMTSAC